MRVRPGSPAGGVPAAVSTAPTAAEVRAQRLAWGVIGGAFVVWCALVALLALEARNFFLTAANPQSALLEIERGEVFYQDPRSPVQARASNGMGLSEGTLLETAEQTEADVTLFDGTGLHLFPGSQVRLDALRLGRFSETASRVALSQPRGATRYVVSGTLPNGQEITVATPHGEVALQRGEYLIWVNETDTLVSAYSGKGHAEAGGRLERFHFGQQLHLRGDRGIDSPAQLGEDLVVNGAFTHELANWQPVDVQEKGRKDVLGRRQLVTYEIDGQQLIGLRVTRDTAKDTHNETGIIQTIQRDVLPYRNLFIRAWVRVDLASLSGGGYAGSEYPMMLQVDYVDKTGGRPGWSHGFYYANPDNMPVVNAELIPQSTWVHYEGNLVELKDRPAYIDSIRIVGSGHDFDAAIAKIELIAE